MLGFERWILFSSSGGDYSHYLRVPEPGGKSYIRKVQVAGYGGRELKHKKDLISAMDEANTAKEKVRVLSDDLRG